MRLEVEELGRHIRRRIDRRVVLHFVVDELERGLVARGVIHIVGVGGRDVEILEDSIDGEMRDANTIVWQVAVPANGETKLTATVEAGGVTDCCAVPSGAMGWGVTVGGVALLTADPATAVPSRGVTVSSMSWP